MKEKLFTVSSVAYGNDDREHQITIVGQFERLKENTYKVIETTDKNGKQVLQIKKSRNFKRIFSMAYSICHPDDSYNEEQGIHIALRRIKSGDRIGTLTTADKTMLNDDQCYAILNNEMRHIQTNINHYINKKRK